MKQNVPLRGYKSIESVMKSQIATQGIQARMRVATAAAARVSSLTPDGSFLLDRTTNPPLSLQQCSRHQPRPHKTSQSKKS